jgi:hypothetical protein
MTKHDEHGLFSVHHKIFLFDPTQQREEKILETELSKLTNKQTNTSKCRAQLPANGCNNEEHAKLKPRRGAASVATEFSIF